MVSIDRELGFLSFFSFLSFFKRSSVPPRSPLHYQLENGGANNLWRQENRETIVPSRKAKTHETVHLLRTSHGRDLMSDRAWGAWKVCSLDGVRAWKRHEPTKWAVVVNLRWRTSGSREADFGRKHLIFSRFVARAHNITTAGHFVGSGRFQAVSSSREHTLHAPEVRSDIWLVLWRR